MAVNLIELTRETLQNVQSFVENSPWKDLYYSRITQLLDHLEDPCTLAIGGRVKAGKSSLMNALLGKDLAKVGITATTATINEFHYRSEEVLREYPSNIQCVYRSGLTEWVDSTFLDSMQGQDPETVRKSREILKMKYYLDNEILREMILVDTPGTEALVEEHTETVDTYFGIIRDSKACVSSADTVLYAFENVATASASEFINHFNQMGGGMLRVVGVMTQIDLTDERLAQRQSIADCIMKDLNHSIHAIVPVSAGLERCIQKMDSDFLDELRGHVQILQKEELDRLLLTENSWLRRPGTSFLPEERTRFYQRFSVPWRVFVILVRHLYEFPTTEAVLRLRELAGVEKLKQLIREHIFSRKRLFRCRTNLEAVRTILYEITNLRFMERVDVLYRDRAQMERFCQFIASHPDKDSKVADELRRFLSGHVRNEAPQQWKEQTSHWILEVEKAIKKLEKSRYQLEVLTLADSMKSSLSESEMDEIRNMAELYGPPQNVQPDRQGHWRLIAEDPFPESEQIRNLGEFMVSLYSIYMQENGA